MIAGNFPITRSLHKALALAAMACACFFAPAATAQQRTAPSFDCAAASSEVERAICADPRLAAADAMMARLYAKAQASPFGSGPSGMARAQRAWIAQRATACAALPAGEQRRDCRLDFLNARNVELAGAAMFADPALALGTLQRIEPEGARLLEAVQVFAAAGGFTSASRARVSEVLAPTMRFMMEAEEAGYGREILTAAGIVNARNMTASEANFVKFVQIASAYVPVRSPPLTMPCAAIVRRPVLLDATGPVFGSTLDNFVFASDCADTLPPAPSLTRLASRISETWPRCQGTIRFASYRLFGLATDAARLGVGGGDQNFRARFPLPQLEGVSPALAQSAVEELAAYYRRYDRVPSAQAARVARARVRDMLETGHECGG